MYARESACVREYVRAISQRQQSAIGHGGFTYCDVSWRVYAYMYLSASILHVSLRGQQPPSVTGTYAIETIMLTRTTYDTTSAPLGGPDTTNVTLMTITTSLHYTTTTAARARNARCAPRIYLSVTERTIRSAGQFWFAIVMTDKSRICQRNNRSRMLYK